ncbi:YecA family protein [Acinetobacter sp.]|uniref:YecA family protein n=1 Tax=Acinetobacter sp. TaxID=472 RepID=UPI00388D3484
MNIGRNDTCYCGSGLKFKKCCISKLEPEKISIQMTIPSLMGVVKFALENLGILSDGVKSVKVKEIRLMNGGDTILCEFYSDHTKSLDIKMEMAGIMGCLSGLFKGDPYECVTISYFSAAAFNDQDEEMLNVVSSRVAASSISTNSIEWLRTSMFTENTPDYRVSRAKTIISDIENAVRQTIKDIYKTKLGANWWHLAIDSKIATSIERTYSNQFGASIIDGDILIDYSYTLDIKKIISADWGSFKHLFAKKNEFEDIMIELNTIRREEAHNRQISRPQLDDLERIFDFLLSEICQLYPSVLPVFMIENWRSKIQDAMHVAYKPVYAFEEFNRLDDDGKRQLMIKDCNCQIEYIEGLLLKLNSFKPPISKKNKHEQLVLQLTKYGDLQERKLVIVTENKECEVAGFQIELEAHKQRMDAFSKKFLLEES